MVSAAADVFPIKPTLYLNRPDLLFSLPGGDGPEC